MHDLKSWLSLALLGACIPARSPAPVELTRSEPVPDSAIVGVDRTARTRDLGGSMRLRADASGPAVWVWIEALEPGQMRETLPHLADWTVTPLLPE